MADNQGEKIKLDEAKLRNEVNELIEKAYPGKTINEIIELKIKTKRGTYFKNVKKRPLSRKFIKMILNDLGVDISILNDTKTNTESTDHKTSLSQKGSIERENELLEEIRQLHKKNIEQAIELAKTQKERDLLKEENNRLKQELKKSA